MVVLLNCHIVREMANGYYIPQIEQTGETKINLRKSAGSAGNFLCVFASWREIFQVFHSP